MKHTKFTVQLRHYRQTTAKAFSINYLQRIAKNSCLLQWSDKLNEITLAYFQVKGKKKKKRQEIVGGKTLIFTPLHYNIKNIKMVLSHI